MFCNKFPQVLYLKVYSTGKWAGFASSIAAFKDSTSLGIRILGEVDKEKADILREADDIFIKELRAADLYKEVSQAFVVLLPVKSVGVMGDERTYEYTAVLRSANTIDFMTATWSRLPYEFLDKVSNRIINEVKGINRLTYDISSKPPATIEWE